MAEGLKQRILTALLLGVPFIALIWINDLTRLILFSAIMIFSAAEYLNLRFRPWYTHPLAWVSLVGSGILLYVSLIYPGIHDYLIWGSFVFNGILVIDLFVRSIPLHRTVPALTSILYTGLPYAILLAMIGTTDFKYTILSMIVLIWISDTSAYFVGKSVGKNKLMPSISPGKTLEGFLGAGMVTMIAAYICFSVIGTYSMQKWFLIGFAVWIFGSIGDLVESKLKRSVNIKDSGNLLPGHGGLLDRFDGFFFSIPFVILIIENF